MNLKQQLTDYIHACFTGIWTQTYEPDEAQAEILALASEKHWDVIRWDIAQGWSIPGQNVKTDPGDPLAPLNALSQVSHPGTDHTTIMILHNYHRFLSNPMVVQKLFNCLVEGKTTRVFIIVLSPVVQIPIELEKVFVVLEHPLPDSQALASISADLGGPDGGASDHVTAAAGLTRYEAEGAFALSLARHDNIKPDEVWELKASMLKKSGLLEMHRGKESFKDLGGLDSLKDFCKRALQPGRPVQPKGILLLGVPGTGKSAFAKALGNETNRPTLTLDIGALFGSLVGQTEERVRQALKIADAMAPCILFVDEIEKALAGTNSSHDGDGGTSKRLFGTLLTWLNDHATDVFFIGTCNDISKLPPEFSRAERFDGIFFIDLPNMPERSKIWDLYLSIYGITTDLRAVDDQNWTGAEIKACCRLAALLDIPLAESAKNIVPVATTASDKVSSLRGWADGRCLSASRPGIYHQQQTVTSTKRRNVARKETEANV